MNVFAGISRSLSGRMLGHSFALLKPVVKALDDAELSEKLRILTEQYLSVAQDFLSGTDDICITDVTDTLVREMYSLSDIVAVRTRLKESTSYEVREMLKQLPSTHETLEDIFRYYWLATLDGGDMEELLLLAEQEETAEKALMGISGLLLNILRCFSSEAVVTLFRLADDKYPQEIRERAWVSVLLCLIKYDERLTFFPEIQEELQDLLLSDDSIVFARTALACLVRTLGVDWASSSYDDLQKMLAPLVEKMMPGTHEKKAVLLDDLDDFTAQFGEEMQSLFEEHRNEMAKMQEEHLDTHFAIIRSMYSTSFFSEIYRWWLPFDEQLLTEDQKKAYLMSKRMSLHGLCDSDRYAFISAVAHVGVLRDGQMLSEEALNDMPISDDDVSDNLLCNGYVKQAYRFFRLNPWQMDNPFELIKDISSTLVFRLLCPTAQGKAITAGQCLRCHAYTVAAAIYRQIADSIDTAQTYRNYAFALQKEKDYDGALAAYKQAQEKETDIWTLRQMAFCYTSIHNYSKALEIASQLLELKPDNMMYHYEQARCLERLELYAEALRVYMFIELKHSGVAKVQRAIAWCSFLCGDYETAELFYGKLMDADKMKDIDYLNIGHLYFVTGKRHDALNAYQHSMRMYDNLKAFLTVFRPDRKFLIEKGLSKTDIYMMEDQLIYIYSQLG